ncbi:hypothetical protein V1517DRAFT_321095, partial [Lipomyces orientalis]
INIYSQRLKCQLRMRMRIIFVYSQGFTNPDYLAIPASEVAVERLFNSGRDLLGQRRHPKCGHHEEACFVKGYVRQRRRILMYLCANIAINYE